MTLSRADFAAIERLFTKVVRRELAAATRSGPASIAGIGALVQGDDQWPESREKEPMDPTHTDDDGESSSLRQMVRDDIARLRRSATGKTTPTRSTTRRQRATSVRASPPSLDTFAMAGGRRRP